MNHIGFFLLKKMNINVKSLLCDISMGLFFILGKSDLPKIKNKPFEILNL